MPMAVQTQTQTQTQIHTKQTQIDAKQTSVSGAPSLKIPTHIDDEAALRYDRASVCCSVLLAVCCSVLAV